MLVHISITIQGIKVCWIKSEKKAKEFLARCLVVLVCTWMLYFRYGDRGKVRFMCHYLSRADLNIYTYNAARMSWRMDKIAINFVSVWFQIKKKNYNANLPTNLRNRFCSFFKCERCTFSVQASRHDVPFFAIWL